MLNTMPCKAGMWALLLLGAEALVVPARRAVPATVHRSAATEAAPAVRIVPEDEAWRTVNDGAGAVPVSDPGLTAAAAACDAATVGAFLEAGHFMDEATTDAAFWAVVRAVDAAEAADAALPLEVPRMLHHIFDADVRLLLGRSQERLNVTCARPELSGADAASSSMGYLMDDTSHQDLPLSPGRKCEDGKCCDACSRNIYRTFASPAECSLETFPELASFTFNELETVPAATILQFARLLERVRRTMAHEYGLPLSTILPLQAYSRKYVAGTTQQGGGGGEGDFVILHTDEATHSSYHYSSVIYLNTQGEEFEGGDFVFNDALRGGPEAVAAAAAAARPTEEEREKMTLEEEMARGRRSRREITPFYPSKGAAVIFTSGWENMHEVDTLTSGTRYAVPSFFTTCPVPDAAFAHLHAGIPTTDEAVADDWLHLLLAHRSEDSTQAAAAARATSSSCTRTRPRTRRTTTRRSST